ncbi:MAG: bifunctional diaminohydroxyphosphoribosylaminopyrimidine deaminase/5-amino-6-(5-phosphoribosylamino)uracil reductase RibD [Desulfosarcinaceae bacterium]|nr:bifunctional diaminohydroxyphosphoribosylaminopyrimidine deaminase/5-amino-6-(5-phosphoribosylamino)uracil reductase RibD [Desulfosarcinaceae bacterium]
MGEPDSGKSDHNRQDQAYMELALELAAQGRGFTSPNPMVGAVVVKDGTIVGRGYHERVGEAHAEVNALDAAGDAARGGTLYVTLEPCNHTGRTPPCTQRVLAAGIQRVVVAMPDPNPDVTGGGCQALRAEGVEVVTGVCAAEAQLLNEVFVKYIRTKRPFVLLKCAMTLDGQLATRSGDSKWVTGPAARAAVHELRHHLDAIMVGRGTVAADDPRLTTRRTAGADGAAPPARDPARVVLDSRLRIDPAARVLQKGSAATTFLIHGPDADADRRNHMTNRGVRLIEVPPGDGGLDLSAVMRALGAAGITSILLEGGGHVIASALQAKLVDKVNLFFAPKLLGGNDGVPMCAGAGPEKMADALALDRVRVACYGPDVMIEGYLR